MYQQQTYPVQEDNPNGVLEACVAIVSPGATSLTTASSVQITFADGLAPSASMSKMKKASVYSVTFFFPLCALHFSCTHSQTQL